MKYDSILPIAIVLVQALRPKMKLQFPGLILKIMTSIRLLILNPRGISILISGRPTNSI